MFLNLKGAHSAVCSMPADGAVHSIGCKVLRCSVEVVKYFELLITKLTGDWANGSSRALSAFNTVASRRILMSLVCRGSPMKLTAVAAGLVHFVSMIMLPKMSQKAMVVAVAGG